MTEQVRTFISYSHKDTKLKDQFVSHLYALIRTENVTLWTDGDLRGGQNWDYEIKRKLESSELILLLISPDFIRSDYIYRIELEIAIDLHNRRRAVVIPIGLRSCDIQHTSFSKLQMLPSNPQFVESWQNLDEAFRNVVEGIRKVLLVITDEIQEWNPIKRKDAIRKLIEIANYEEACNRLIDFISDFSENEDLKDKGSQVKSDYTDLLIIQEEMKKQNKQLEFYEIYRRTIKDIKQQIFELISKVIEEQNKTGF